MCQKFYICVPTALVYSPIVVWSPSDSKLPYYEIDCCCQYRPCTWIPYLLLFFFTFSIILSRQLCEPGSPFNSKCLLGIFLRTYPRKTSDQYSFSGGSSKYIRSVKNHIKRYELNTRKKVNREKSFFLIASRINKMRINIVFMNKRLLFKYIRCSVYVG